MKNKKANVIELVVKAVLLLIFLFVIFGLIKSIFIDKEIAHANVQAESITKDCDGDEAIGVMDQCPCDDLVQKLKKGKKCGAAIKTATENCPAACKVK